MRSIFRAALVLTVFTGAWLAASPAYAKEDGSDFVGTFAPVDEIEPIFKITRNKGRLAVYIQQDDEACGWLPLAGKAELGKRLDRTTSGQVQSIVMGSWGVIYHAPKGWRLSEDFGTRTGFFVTFTPATGSAPVPRDFRKVHLESGCR